MVIGGVHGCASDTLVQLGIGVLDLADSFENSHHWGEWGRCLYVMADYMYQNFINNIMAICF